jgi:hypothetical protein
MGKQKIVSPTELPTTKQGHIEAARIWLARAETGFGTMMEQSVAQHQPYSQYPQVCAQLAQAHATLALTAD